MKKEILTHYKNLTIHWVLIPSDTLEILEYPIKVEFKTKDIIKVRSYNTNYIIQCTPSEKRYLKSLESKVQIFNNILYNYNNRTFNPQAASALLDTLLPSGIKTKRK